MRETPVDGDWRQVARVPGQTLADKFPGVVRSAASGHGQARNIVQAMREGAADFLRKPFEVKELEKILREVLAGQTATICPTCHGAGRV